MRQTVVALLTLLAAISIFAESHRRFRDFSCGVCVSPQVKDVNSCDQLRVIFNDEDALRAEEEVAIDAGRPVSVRAQNGGIHVRASSDGRYSVHACKAGDTAAALNKARVTVTGNEIASAGPASDTWIVFFIVSVPRGGSAKIETIDGPLSLMGVDANITASAQNGPIDLTNATGVIRASAENGPIAITGSGGDIVVHTENGPIDVNLRGTNWATGKLSARSDNGPVALHYPRRYGSRINLETDGNSHIKCRAEECRNGRIKIEEDEDGDVHWPRRIELGSGAPVVSIIAHNGPVSIEDR